jgi:hypothetical protein
LGGGWGCTPDFSGGRGKPSASSGSRSAREAGGRRGFPPGRGGGTRMRECRWRTRPGRRIPGSGWRNSDLREHGSAYRGIIELTGPADRRRLFSAARIPSGRSRPKTPRKSEDPSPSDRGELCRKPTGTGSRAAGADVRDLPESRRGKAGKTPGSTRWGSRGRISEIDLVRTPPPGGRNSRTSRRSSPAAPRAPSGTGEDRARGRRPRRCADRPGHCGIVGYPGAPVVAAAPRAGGSAISIRAPRDAVQAPEPAPRSGCRPASRDSRLVSPLH